MSAITIARTVAASVGIDEPSTLTGGGTGPNPMLTLLNRACRILAKKRGPFGESWPELTREFSLSTEAGTEYYALPQDFANLITDTAWDRSTYRQAQGPMTPQEWAEIKGGLIGSTSLTPRYRLAFDRDANRLAVRLDPVPAEDSEQIAFEYLSRYWGRESAGAAITLEKMSADAHEPVFPEYLVELDLEWRVRKAQGLDYRTDIAEFEMERDRAFAQAVGHRRVNIARRRRRFGPNIPEGDWGLTS